jgi:signal transduction histidine kinase
VLQLAPVDVRPVLRELAGAAELLGPGTDVDVGWSVADDCPLILADPTRLHQVLSNLVVNAVKFTERGSIRLRAEPDGDGRVVISVTDTGIGIPPEVRAALFDPTRRAPDPRHRIPGSGIGLSIASKLAGLMRAELRVASEPGKGTHFALSVPAATIADAGCGTTARAA